MNGLSRLIRVLSVALLALVLVACGAGDGAVPTPTGDDPAGPVSLDDASTIAEVLTAVDGLSAEERESALLAKAEDEGPLVGYLAIPIDDAEGLMQAFIARYPSLAQQHLGLGGGETLERILSEAAAGRHLWDVAIVNPEHMQALRDENLIASYTGPSLAELAPEHQDPDGEWVDLYVSPEAHQYNTNEVAEPAQTLEDLTDPRFRGLLTLGARDFEWHALVIEQLGEEQGLDLMRRLAANEPITTQQASEQRELVSSGEAIAAVTLGDETTFRHIQEGSPIEMVYLDIAIAKHGPAVLSNNASNPAAAVLFFDWVTSAEGQRVGILEGTGRVPVHPDVESTLTPELAERRQGVDFASVDLNRFAADFEEIGTRYAEIFLDE